MIAQRASQELALNDSFSVINFVDALIHDAFVLHASDIHIHPTENIVRIRFRVDGLLYDVCEFNNNLFPEIVSRIKILSRLRTDEHKSPQDGRFRHKNNENRSFDVRVSCVPTQHGESVVLRLLVNTASNQTLLKLGFSNKNEEQICGELKKQWGMVLVTGPTGSGKTTTLYTLLKILNTRETSIVTIEDPIEYALDGIKQIQTQPRVGLTFAHGLRSVLRQDPDTIMVGEIRDTETAHIAVNTALTGHLLLSTLHTVNASTAIPRLIDMGVEPFLVASTLRVVIAQRLVRKICEKCKKPFNFSDIEKESCKKIFGFYPRLVFRGIGCDNCLGSGYVGRITVDEVLIVDEYIRELIVSRSSSVYIQKNAFDLGMVLMAQDGIQKVEEGITTIEEVLRCLHE